MLQERAAKRHGMVDSAVRITGCYEQQCLECQMFVRIVLGHKGEHSQNTIYHDFCLAGLIDWSLLPSIMLLQAALVGTS